MAFPTQLLGSRYKRHGRTRRREWLPDQTYPVTIPIDGEPYKQYDLPPKARVSLGSRTKRPRDLWDPNLLPQHSSHMCLECPTL